jgi:Zinc knuckle
MPTRTDEGRTGEKAYLTNSTGRWRDSRVCYHCGKKGHIKSECRRRADNRRERGSNLPAVALTASTSNTETDSNAWVLDSGATQHMTGNRELLSSMTTLAQDVCVTYGNNVKLKATGIGTATIRTAEHPEGITLMDVLYVPTAVHNLFSISRALKNGADVSFTKYGCTVSLDGSTIARASRGRDHLYYIETSQRTETALLTRTQVASEIHRESCSTVCRRRGSLDAVGAQSTATRSVPTQWGQKPWRRRQWRGTSLWTTGARPSTSTGCCKTQWKTQLDMYGHAQRKHGVSQDKTRLSRRWKQRAMLDVSVP